MNHDLQAFDESCVKLRKAFAECIRLRALYDRRAGALESTWLAWLNGGKFGDEPLVPEDCDVARMLSAACEVARRRYAIDVHVELLSTYGACSSGTMREREDALQQRQSCVLEWLEPQLREAIGVPVRMAFSREYPECLQMIVHKDVSPDAMNKAATILDAAGSGALRFCANVVEDDDLLQGRPDSFPVAMAQSWGCYIATVRHEATQEL